MSLPIVRDHTNGIISALEAELVVGDAVAPDVDPPYAVVYPVPGGSTSGTLADPDDDAVFVYQVTCVGKSREQAEWIADKVLQLLQAGVTGPGRRVLRVSPDMHGGIQRDDQVTPPVFASFPRFRIISTPREDGS